MTKNQKKSKVILDEPLLNETIALTNEIIQRPVDFNSPETRENYLKLIAYLGLTLYDKMKEKENK